MATLTEKLELAELIGATGAVQEFKSLIRKEEIEKEANELRESLGLKFEVTNEKKVEKKLRKKYLDLSQYNPGNFVCLFAAVLLICIEHKMQFPGFMKFIIGALLAQAPLGLLWCIRTTPIRSALLGRQEAKKVDAQTIIPAGGLVYYDSVMMQMMMGASTASTASTRLHGNVWSETLPYGAMLAVKEAKEKGIKDFRIYYPVKNREVRLKGDPIIVGFLKEHMVQVFEWDDFKIREA